MAITINSLTPLSSTIIAGAGVTFTVNATDSGGATLTYLWQISTDSGNTYSSSGLSNNTNASYTINGLSQNQSGLYVRVVISNGIDTVNSDEDSNIGPAIINVTAAPSIVAFVDETVYEYPISKTISVNETFDFTVDASLVNVDISTATNVSNINIQWQESTDTGSTWTNLSNGGDYTIVATTAAIVGQSPTAYHKYSSLEITGSGFARNLNQYRAVITYPSATNSPVQTNGIILFVEPVLNIFEQPGDASDNTAEFQCFKTGIANSGEIKCSVGALTTAATTLLYDWEITFDDGLDWLPISSGIYTGFAFLLKTGTTSTSDVLELERVIWYERIGLRCQVSGSSGETPIISDSFYVYPKDVQESPNLQTALDFVEDRYGPIANRSALIQPISIASIETSIDVSRNQGLNGAVSIQYERQDSGSSTWTSVGEVFTQPSSDTLIDYEQAPSTDESLFEMFFTTDALRRDTDDGTKFRLRIESTALFTLNSGPPPPGDYASSRTSAKTINPYYSSEMTLNVYRTVFITNPPTDSSAYAGQATAFSVSADPSSGSANDITYQWQYDDGSGNFINISNGGIYSGATTNLLTIDPIPANATYNIYRCVLSIPDQLSSTTSRSATLYPLRDFFTEFSSLNDIIVFEAANISWSVTAASLSASLPTYQWQKSINYNPTLDTGTWSDITGETNSSIDLLSVQTSDAGYYRCKVTSFGGEIRYTNAAELEVLVLAITTLLNIADTQNILENVVQPFTLEALGTATNGNNVNYQWQYKLPTTGWTAAPSGFGNSPSNTRYYTPSVFTRDQDGVEIRCEMTAPGMLAPFYTNDMTVTVNRRFTYLKNPDTINVTDGSTLVLDLAPIWTGGTPTFQWQRSTGGGWSNIGGETSSVLYVVGVTNSINGYKYRCLITLTDCNQHAYVENGVLQIVSVSGSPPTEEVQISVVAGATKPNFYSNLQALVGAAIGTVICIPKPSNYIASPGEDRQRWGITKTGSNSTVGTLTSAVSGGGVYNANKPSWVSNPNYRASKVLEENNRFPGFIEMRGQMILAAEFPELARMFGTEYGGSISGTYPRYNANDKFRLPLLYAKKLMGTGNVNNNSGSVSIIPEYNPNDSSGGDKLKPGSMGGVYNYIKSAQLPPGSPGITGIDDGTADGAINERTFNIGSFQTLGWESVENFVQPEFQGSVTYRLPTSFPTFTRTPVHTHTGISMGGTRGYEAVNNSCNGNSECLNNCGIGQFYAIEGGFGEILEGPYGLFDGNAGQVHNHPNTGYLGFFDMVKEGNMFIGSTNARMNIQTKQLFDGALEFTLRNNEHIPVNAPYFRLKYLIKAY